MRFQAINADCEYDPCRHIGGGGGGGAGHASVSTNRRHGEHDVTSGRRVAHTSQQQQQQLQQRTHPNLTEALAHHVAACCTCTYRYDENGIAIVMTTGAMTTVVTDHACDIL